MRPGRADDTNWAALAATRTVPALTVKQLRQIALDPKRWPGT
ncbi:hypothetical protein ACFVT2_04080 [Streptomyces sp. NPDC058000]